MNIRQRLEIIQNKAQTKEDHSQLEDFLCEAVEDGFRILGRIDIS